MTETTAPDRCSWGPVGTCTREPIARVTSVSARGAVVAGLNGPDRLLCGDHVIREVCTSPDGWTVRVAPLADAQERDSRNFLASVAAC